MKRHLRDLAGFVVLALVMTVATALALPALGWTAETGEAVVGTGFDLARWVKDMQTVVAVGAVSLASLLVLVRFALRVVAILSKSDEHKAIAEKLVVEIDRLKQTVDLVPGLSVENPAEIIHDNLKRWKRGDTDPAPAPKVVKELDAIVQRLVGPWRKP